MRNLQSAIREYRASWSERGKWQDPTLADAVDFVITEIGELRRALEYGATKPELATEAFDVFMMASISADVAGLLLATTDYKANSSSILKAMLDNLFQLVEARLRLENCYTRNNPAPGDMGRLAYNLSMIASLAIAFVESVGMDITEVGRMKLEQMEAKRQ